MKPLSWRAWLFVTAILAADLVVMVIPAVRESQTQDEGVYVTSGLSYWRTHDFRLNVEHPPLLKELMSLPLVVSGATFQPKPPDWNGASEWDVAPWVLYNNIKPGPDLLLLSRLVTIILALALVLLVAAWARRTWGDLAGGTALVVMAFEPNFLAHGHLATTDVGYTLALLGSIFAFGWMLERPSRMRVLTAAAIFGLALVTRFNALALFAVLPLLSALVALQRRRGWSAAGVAKVVGVFLVVGFMVVWASYGFEVRRMNRVQDQTAHETLSPLPAVDQWLRSTPLPAMSYLSGALFQFNHNQGGQPAYLLGRTNDYGWWYYPLVAMAVKMTLAVFLLLGLSVIAWKRFRPAGGSAVFSGWFTAVAAIVLTVAALPSQLSLGLRYVLPSIALLVILAACAGELLRHRGWRYAVAAFAALHLVSVLRFSPHYLPYANEAFGGPLKLDQILIDSNLDWGQDMPLVRKYLDAHGINDYTYYSFSTAPAAPYGLYERDIPTDEDVALEPFRGVLIIGKSWLYFPGNRFDWLRRMQPTEVLGYSTNVYDLR